MLSDLQILEGPNGVGLLFVLALSNLNPKIKSIVLYETFRNYTLCFLNFFYPKHTLTSNSYDTKCIDAIWKVAIFYFDRLDFIKLLDIKERFRELKQIEKHWSTPAIFAIRHI